MNKVDKSWWRCHSKRYCFNAKNVKDINSDIFNNATKYRIVVITTPGDAKYYIIEGYVNNEWKLIKGTSVMFSSDKCHWYRNYENAYNRCKKIARKFPEIKMKDLIYESGYASMIYGNAIIYPNGYKCVELNEI